MTTITIVSTLAAWVAGLLLDANLDFDPRGFLCLRILLPLLAMGLYLLKAVKESKNEQGK